MPDKEGKLTPEELKDRWTSDEGRKFREEIIRQLKSEKHFVEWVNLQVTTDDGRTIHWRDFPGVVELKKPWEKNEDKFLFEMVHEHGGSNGEWGDLRSICLIGEEIPYALLTFVNMENAILSEAKLEHAILGEVKLEYADLRWTRLEHANLIGAKLEHAYLNWARLEHANLSEAKLEYANLIGTNLENADLSQANLENANLSRASLKHADLSRTRLGGADLNRAIFKLKSFWWRIGFVGILEKFGMDISRFIPTRLTEAEIRNAKLDSDQVLLRELLDEPYLDRMEEIHPKFYWFWLLTSNCGRGVWLLFGLSLLLAIGFGLIYAELYSPAWFPSWLHNFLSRLDPKFKGFNPDSGLWDPIYMSFVTMTTLGWATVNPANWQGYLWNTLQMLFGYIWLGYLVAVLGSKLTRRSG